MFCVKSEVFELIINFFHCERSGMEMANSTDVFVSGFTTLTKYIDYEIMFFTAAVVTIQRSDLELSPISSKL